MDIKIEYDGQSPNLCSGDLKVTVDNKEWQFPAFCLSSGGGVAFDDDWTEDVSKGPWSVSNWPEGFPDNLKLMVVAAVNENIPYGCCGGCV